MSQQQSASQSGYSAYIPSLPKRPKYLNDAGCLRTIRIERRGRKHRLSILNTTRAVIAYKDHASRKAANAQALDLVTNGSWA